ncbi:MAG: alpha/beta fold hydrolase [Saprospiraceae bacterium]
MTAQKTVELTIEPYTFENRAGTKVEAELGSFQVPANRQKADGKMLNLKFVRFKSTNPNPGSPIVYLAGGPGGSGVSTAQGTRFDLFMSMRAIGDVIAFDQRGTGLSNEVPAYEKYWIADMDKPLMADEITSSIQIATLKATNFFASEGHDVKNYNSNESADDLNDLRLALGTEKISIWSISYGSHLALTTIKRHEQHLDRVILAGVEGYDHTVKLPADQQALLEKIDQLLKDNPTTAAVYPDFLGDIARLLTQLEKEPAIVQTQNPMTKEPMDVVLGKLDMQILIAAFLGAPAYSKQLPLLVKNMLAGDFSGMAEFASYPKSIRFNGMSMGMDIASGISPERLEVIKTTIPQTLLGDAINFPYLMQWEVLQDLNLDLGDEFRKPYAAKLPVLAISGTMDGRTPPTNATETLAHFTNSHHLLIEGAGHSDPLFLSSPRIEQQMLAFMRGELIKDEVITLPPVEFNLPE